MDVSGADLAVMHGGMMFGEVVTQVVSTFAPVHEELSLSNTVLNPIKAHVHGFGLALSHSTIGDASSTGIVSLYRCRWLRPSHFEENVADHDPVFSIVKKASEFGFCGRGHDIFEYVADGVDGPVGWGNVGWGLRGIKGLGSEVEVAANTAASFGGGQVGGITVDVEGHVTGCVAEVCIGMCCGVVEESSEGNGSGIGAAGLGCSKGAEGDEHGGVDCTCVEEEGADDLLEALDAGRVEGGTGVIEGSQLDGGAEDRLYPSVGGMFGATWLWMWILKAMQSRVNVLRHGEVNGAIGVVPLKC